MFLLMGCRGERGGVGRRLFYCPLICVVTTTLFITRKKVPEASLNLKRFFSRAQQALKPLFMGKYLKRRCDTDIARLGVLIQLCLQTPLSLMKFMHLERSNPPSRTSEEISYYPGKTEENLPALLRSPGRRAVPKNVSFWGFSGLR